MTENTKGEKVQYLIFTMLLAVLVIGFAGTAKAENWYDGWHESSSRLQKMKTEGLYILKNHCTGTSTITGKIGDKEYSFKVIVKPYMGAKMSSVKAVDYKSVKVTWQKANAATVGTHTFKQ